MDTSIQQLVGKLTEGILAEDLFAVGLSEYLEINYKKICEFLTELVSVQIKAADDLLFEKDSWRKGWKVVKKNEKRELITAYGVLRYKRRYYRNEKSKVYAHLVDHLIGVEKYSKVELGLAAKLCELATEHSYSQSSHLASGGQVSRQTVMKKVQKVKVEELEKPLIRDQVKIVHIQLDEDHVALQDKRKSTIVKLAAIHESFQNKGGRNILPHRFLLCSYAEENDDFWSRIADEISERYGDREDLQVYIHGDGANWIKAGTQWIKNSQFVLDAFHIKKYMQPVIHGDKHMENLLYTCMKEDRYKMLYKLVNLQVEEEICAEETGADFLRYVRNNWRAIRIRYEEPQSGPSCAEGLVSHYLSARLSSRPKGWLDRGLDAVSRLRIYAYNGGKIKAKHLRNELSTLTLHPKASKILSKATSDFLPLPTDKFRSEVRTSPSYRLFKAITESGKLF